MTNLMLLSSMISLLSASPTTSFSSFLNIASDNDIQIIQNNNINTWDDYYAYLNNNNLSSFSGPNSQGLSYAFSNPLTYLNNYYSSYEWIKDPDSSAYTSDVSNGIPKELRTNNFYSDCELSLAIQRAHVSNKTNYGGCGPIAIMGILDYFSRYLGYKEFIENPDDRNQRITLATEVLSRTTFSLYGNVENSLVWPLDLGNIIDSFAYTLGLSSAINVVIYPSYFGNSKNTFWSNIKFNIDRGIPITLGTGFTCGSGEFAQHYTNIYGYETWVGIDHSNNTRITKQFLKARLNKNITEDSYCDADILNCSQIATVAYEFYYSNTTSFTASDFSSLVNSNGNGQYFFDDTFKQITLNSGVNIDTYRLRTSYIENQYLVLSPNRSRAGTAFLQLGFYHPVEQLTFSASLWSSLEGVLGQTFVIQYEDSNFQYVNHISIDLNKLSTSKTYKDNFLIVFPKETSGICFYTHHNAPSGNRNKGRIVLDNFAVKYNTGVSIL